MAWDREKENSKVREKVLKFLKNKTKINYIFNIGFKPILKLSL